MIEEKAKGGVFLSVLFDRDPNMVTPYYADAADFHRKTGERFQPHSVKRHPSHPRFGSALERDFWPTDAHGDHDFQFNGAGVHACTGCSATMRYV